MSHIWVQVKMCTRYMYICCSTSVILLNWETWTSDSGVKIWYCIWLVWFVLRIKHVFVFFFSISSLTSWCCSFSSSTVDPTFRRKRMLNILDFFLAFKISFTYSIYFQLLSWLVPGFRINLYTQRVFCFLLYLWETFFGNASLLCVEKNIFLLSYASTIWKQVSFFPFICFLFWESPAAGQGGGWFNTQTHTRTQDLGPYLVACGSLPHTLSSNGRLLTQLWWLNIPSAHAEEQQQ